jgi:hypothetical protein
MTWDLGDQGAGKTALRLGLAKMMYHEEQWKPCETVADMFSTYDNGLLIDKKFIYLNELSTIDKKIAAKLRKVVSERERTYKALYENKIQGFDLATYTASPATPRSRRSSRPVKKPRLMTVRRGEILCWQPIQHVCPQRGIQGVQGTARQRRRVQGMR